MTNDPPPAARVFLCEDCATRALNVSVYVKRWTDAPDVCCLHFYARWTQ